MRPRVLAPLGALAAPAARGDREARTGHAVERQVVITLESVDRQLLGTVAAQIRELRPPEPYKGKGIKYSTETIRRKAGKAAAGSTAA